MQVEAVSGSFGAEEKSNRGKRCEGVQNSRCWCKEVQKRAFCNCFAVILDFCWLSSLFLNRRKKSVLGLPSSNVQQSPENNTEITENCNIFAEQSNLVKSVKNIFC